MLRTSLFITSINFQVMKILIIIFLLFIRRISCDSLSSFLKEYNISSNIIIDSSNINDFSNSIKVANQRCENYCPDYVFKPNSVEDISKLMKMMYTLRLMQNISIDLSVRGGGHSYTCQAVKNGGILIDMRNFDHVHINGDFINVGAGLSFKKIFNVLNKNDRTIIHGQCLDVGVVGFTIHGGVHFGSLSNIYGVGSDNMVGVNMVVANGSIVEINTNNETNSIECLIDNVIGDSNECYMLMKGMKGAGSSFGIVTSLDLKLVKSSHIRTALTIVTLDVSNIFIAEEIFQKYLSKFPSNMSVTFFGLDEYFKAYFFVLKFANNLFDVIKNNNFSHLFKKYNNAVIHFIIEVSWINDDATYELHPLLKTFNNDNEIQNINILHIRPWFVSKEPWWVPSYDLVWGSGHYYSGASITVDRDYTRNVLLSIFKSFTELRKHKFCSDCVVVIHRVGDGLKLAHDTNSSFNSFIQKSHIWVEIDCGHFFRRQFIKKDWELCRKFVDRIQNDLDKCTTDESRMHYVNVPNLKTENWQNQYYGEKNYKGLQRTKMKWDEFNILNHVQSIKPRHLVSEKSFNKLQIDKKNDVCKNIYFNKGLDDLRIALKVIFSLSTSAILLKLIHKFILKIIKGKVI